ncbi:MAG: GAF domain-containing sensor histidine kinase [Acidimicrobiia bacterium]|nr:GAF domain-containing sensor histidine kinase [Acidimicrobiia bacterium]
MDNDELTTRPITDLIKGAAAVIRQSDLQAVLQKTVETAMRLTGARYGALGVIGEHGTLVDFVYSGIDAGTADLIGPLPLGKGVLGTLTTAGKTIRLENLADHIDSVGFPPGHPAMESFLGVPIRLGDRIFGNLYLTDKDDGFTDNDEALVESLAVIAGSAISTAGLHARLKRVAVIEDRERIARDLHDAIIQDLFAVGLSLQGLGMRMVKDESRRSIDDAVERLDDAIASLRRFIFGLRPPVWADRNLRLELADLVGQLSEPHAVDVDLKVPATLVGLHPEVVETSIHLVREALSNALRHSGASAVQVVVEQVDTTVFVRVADDGHGFDPATVRRGLGLDNLETRATGIGGTMELRSYPGAGTTVTFRLPTSI